MKPCGHWEGYKKPAKRDCCVVLPREKSFYLSVAEKNCGVQGKVLLEGTRGARKSCEKHTVRLEGREISNRPLDLLPACFNTEFKVDWSAWLCYLNVTEWITLIYVRSLTLFPRVGTVMWILSMSVEESPETPLFPTLKLVACGTETSGWVLALFALIEVDCSA